MRDHKRRAPRPFPASLLFLAFVLALVLAMSGCASRPVYPFDPSEPVYPASDWPSDSHNEYGGLISACGELPPLIGDDC
jgi:hypothetical protein